MIFAETYFNPYTPPTLWDWTWYYMDTLVIPGIVAAFFAYQVLDAYLTAFHRKSGARLMYDGEPEEWRWRWEKL